MAGNFIKSFSLILLHLRVEFCFSKNTKFLLFGDFGKELFLLNEDFLDTLLLFINLLYDLVSKKSIFSNL